MNLFTDSFLEGLRSSGWQIDPAQRIAYGQYRFRNRTFDFLVAEDITDEDEETVRVEIIYVSRYSSTVRAQRLLKEYYQSSGRSVVCVPQNRLSLKRQLAILDEDGQVIDPDSLTEFMFEFATQFFELVSAYEVCARQTEPVTRVRNKYQKVLPSRQVEMIMNDHMVS